MAGSLDIRKELDMSAVKEGIKLRGFYHVQIEDPDGSIVGDSGWCENQVTNEGILGYLVKLLGAIAGSSQISYAALGSAGAPASNATTLPSELAEGVRKQVTAASNGSSAVRFTVTFGSSDSFVTATRNISNIGLFALTVAGTLFAGNSYNSSSCATNQNVNCTYDISWS